MASADDIRGHVPVLPEAVIEGLELEPGQTIVDCTLGLGGHAERIMPLLAPGGRYIALDMDPDARPVVRRRLGNPPVRLDLIGSNFARLRRVLDELGVDRVDGVLADLGVCSIQLDNPVRGLSFRADGPLDMRLDPQSTVTAADLVARLSERDLADLIWRYGEERLSRKIARFIVETRTECPIKNTRQLAELCSRAYGARGRRYRIDPATRTFQALRIAVNDEIGSLESLLEQLPRVLRPGGRAAIIAFHSLEDRPVKQAFRAWKQAGLAEWRSRRPVTADSDEIQNNPRSRSAKLRVIRWLGAEGS